MHNVDYPDFLIIKMNIIGIGIPHSGTLIKDNRFNRLERSFGLFGFFGLLRFFN